MEDKYFISINDVLDCHHPAKKKEAIQVTLSKPALLTKEDLSSAQRQTTEVTYGKWLAMTAFGAGLGATAMWAYLKK